MISFFVPGQPKPQPRIRRFMQHGRVGVYTPGTCEEWKTEIALAAKPHLPAEPLTRPLRVTLHFYITRPKSHSTKKGLRPNAPYWLSSTPDIDNLAKAVTDCLTRCGMWKDDAQVVWLVATKRYVDVIRGCSIHVAELSETEES